MEYQSVTHWIKYFTDKLFPEVTKEESDAIEHILKWDDGKRAAFFLAKRLFEEEDEVMDKQIRKIEKETKKVGKDLKNLEKMDKKRDKVCDYGEKAMKQKKK